MEHKVIDIIVRKSPHLHWLATNTIFLSLHGSRAYNTHVEGSDEDFKGVAIPPTEYLYSFDKSFEQAILQAPDPDTTIFGLQKFFTLASVCNPNVLEILFTDPSSHIFVSPIGEELLANRQLFLSKRVKHTMCGYAYDQMNRIERHRRWIREPRKEAPSRLSFGLSEKAEIQKNQYDAVEANIRKILEQYNFNFLDDCPEPTKIAIRNEWHDMLTDLHIGKDDLWTAAARQIGLNDNFIEIMQKERAYRNAQEDFKKYLKWKANRNPLRYALEEQFGYDTKHGYHLVRLMRMCREILTTGKVNVKRDDREELLEIRNGTWSFEELKEFFVKEQRELDILYEASTLLPRIPDMKVLNILCISLFDKMLKQQ